jgi:pilus assembly protein CpaB
LKKKRLAILVLQLVLLVAMIFSFISYTNKKVEPVTAYVFLSDLEANHKIVPTDYRLVQIPASAVSNRFVTDPKSLENKFTSAKVFKGTYVYQANLTEKGKMDPFASMDVTKMRKISLPITFVDGFGGNLKRGDQVDLVFSGTGKKTVTSGVTSQEIPFNYAKTFLQDVYVYSVTTDDGYQYVDHSITSTADANQAVTATTGTSPDAQKIDTSSSNNKISVVTLAVSLDQAEEITARLTSGKIRLVSRFDENQSYETAGYVLGDYDKVFTGSVNAETSKTTVKN